MHFYERSGLQINKSICVVSFRLNWFAINSLLLCNSIIGSCWASSTKWDQVALIIHRLCPLSTFIFASSKCSGKV